MQAEKYYPIKKDKYRLPLNYGGDGRYFYVLCGGSSPAKVSVIDSTLITAANYLGAGLWTVNPEIAVITLSAGTCNAIIYIPTTKEVWVVGQTSTKIIDANPASPTFNTEVGTSSGISALLFALAWDSWNQTLIVNANQNLAQFSAESRTIIANSQNGGQGQNRMGKFFNPLGLVMLCNEGTGLSFADSTQIIENQDINKKFFASTGSSSCSAWSSEKYIYFSNTGSVQVYDAQFRLVTTIAITASRCSRAGFSEKNARLIFGSLFANTISFIEESTLTGGGNLTKGYIHASEDGTREFVCSDDVAIGIPSAFAASSVNLQHVHGINMAAKTYIGYIPLTGLLASFTANNSYNVQNACKNRIEV